MTVTIHQAKTNLSNLIQQALNGEEVTISKGKIPVVQLIPVSTALPERRFDGAKEAVSFISEDFDDEIDDFKE
jgi:prevent-host-death family protein